MAERFYVYAIKYENGVVAYVGKGSGRRLNAQIKRFGLDGCVLKRFKREKDAYAYEVKMIAYHKPEFNRHKGGNGSRATVAREWRMSPEASRKYAARVLMRFGDGLKKFVPDIDLEAISRVANGT